MKLKVRRLRFNFATTLRLANRPRFRRPITPPRCARITRTDFRPSNAVSPVRENNRHTTRRGSNRFVGKDQNLQIDKNKLYWVSLKTIDSFRFYVYSRKTISTLESSTKALSSIKTFFTFGVSLTAIGSLVTLSSIETFSTTIVSLTNYCSITLSSTTTSATIGRAQKYVRSPNF